MDWPRLCLHTENAPSSVAKTIEVATHKIMWYHTMPWRELRTTGPVLLSHRRTLRKPSPVSDSGTVRNYGIEETDEITMGVISSTPKLQLKEHARRSTADRNLRMPL
jgi:hypothetical protein